MAVRVFLVEDQRPMQLLISDLLDSIGGFELVGSASNETQATDWLYSNQGGWDLAILDLLLGEGSGFTLIGRASKNPGGSVLVFSDFVTPVVQQRCLRLGADRVISKEEFGELRAFLQGFRGRIAEAAAA